MGSRKCVNLFFFCSNICVVLLLLQEGPTVRKCRKEHVNGDKRDSFFATGIAAVAPLAPKTAQGAPRDAQEKHKKRTKIKKMSNRNQQQMHLNQMNFTTNDAYTQSINQSIKQSSNQAIKQSSDQAIEQSSNEAAKQSRN